MPDEPFIPSEGAPPVDPGTLSPPLGDDSAPTEFADASRLFAALKGDWTLDMSDSIIPGSDGMTVEQDILLKMEDDGRFLAAAPAVVARVPNSAIPDLSVAVKMAVEGQLSALPELTPEGIAIQVADVKVLESQYIIAGDGLATGEGKGADISILVAPLIDDFIGKIVGPGFLDFCSNGDDQVLTFTTGPDFKQVFKRPAPFARMHSLRFLNSLIMHRNVPPFEKVVDWDKVGLRTAGEIIPNAEPHWSETNNHPALYLRGDTVTVEVEIELKGGTRFKLFGIDPGRWDSATDTYAGNGPKYLAFESGETVATGGRQKLTLHAKLPLPSDRVSQYATHLRWNIYLPETGVWGRVEQPRPGRQSGLHRIYATYAPPIAELSNGIANPVTESRIRLLTLCLAADKGLPPGQTDKSDQQIAHQIQNSVNSYIDTSIKEDDQDKDPAARHPISTRSKSTFGGGAKMQHSPEWLWHLMDAGTTARGHCAEATFLMEAMLRMLGVDADQTHVFGRSTLDGDLAEGTNYRQHSMKPKSLLGKGPEKRTCPLTAKAEELVLNFDTTTTRDSLNEGEGCVMVGDALYTGLITHTVRARDGRKAPHELLLLIEAQYGGLKAKNRKTHFQVWAKSSEIKGASALHCPHIEPGQSLSGYPVPK
jgi:hypothetical protein